MVATRRFGRYIFPVLVAVLVVIFGTLSSWAVGKILKVELPPVCESWNDNYVMEVSLFVTGLLTGVFIQFI